MTAVEDDRATVMLEADAACGQGMACSHCALFRPEAHTLQVRRGQLREGDRVRLLVSARSTYRSVAVLFVLPMALAIVGYFVGARFAGEGSDLPGVLGCVAGLAVAILIALAVNRRLADVSDLEIERIGGSPTGD